MKEVRTARKTLIVCPKPNKKRKRDIKAKKGSEKGKTSRGSIHKQTRNPYYYIKNAIEGSQTWVGPAQRVWLVSLQIVSFEQHFPIPKAQGFMVKDFKIITSKTESWLSASHLRSQINKYLSNYQQQKKFEICSLPFSIFAWSDEKMVLL